MTDRHPTDADPNIATAYDRMAAAADSVGIRRVHLIGWRDIDHPEAGGSEEHATQLGRHLTGAGLEVVHHTGAVPGAPTEVVRDGVRVVRRGGKVGVFLTTITDSLRGRLGPRDGLIDIFHGAPFFAPLWARGPQIGIIHHVHLGTWHHLIHPPFDRIGHLTEAHLVRHVYRRTPIVTVAESTRDEIVARMGIPREHVTVAPQGLAERFAPGGERHPRPLVVAVARMMPQKGLADLIPILAATREKVPDMEAVIVGDGPQRPQLEHLRREHDAEAWLQMPGRLDDDEVVDWYRRAWVVASASHREGFGLTLIESAACGTPVVATSMPGHTDAVAEGISGHLVHGPEEFTTQLSGLLLDDERRERLARTALEWTSRFSWEASAEAILDALVRDAARRRSSRRTRG